MFWIFLFLLFSVFIYFIYMYYTSVIYTLLTYLTYIQSLSFLNILQYLEYSDNTITEVLIDRVNQTNWNINTFKKISSEHELKIKYYLSTKPYVVLYYKSQPFQKFPIYTNLELEKKAFEKNSDSIILLELYDFNDSPLILEDKVMDNLLKKTKEYAGPKGNFYEDIHFYDTDESKFLLKKYLFNELEQLSNVQIKKISLMYSDGSDYTLQ